MPKWIISHISQPLILLLVLLIYISNISMGCEIGELRDLKLKIPCYKGLELTDNLTDPNDISHNSQIIIDPPLFPNILHI